jgi:putative oxidoreductase
MKNFLKSFKDVAALLLRLGAGAGFVFVYGFPKITGGPEMWTKIGLAMSNFGITFLPVFWGFMAALSEFGGGILLILGLFTRTTSFFMAFTMLVATVQHLSKLDPWNRVLHPIELLSVFLAIIILGGGKYSLDNLFFKKKS